MKGFKKLAVLAIVMAAVAGCATIKQRLGLNEETTFNIVVDKDGAGLKGKQDVYNAIKNMIGPSNTVIIYDASGSMRYETRVEGEKQTQKRYELAYQGLAKISELFDEKDHVSLLVFGSKIPYALSEGKKTERVNFEKAMKTHSDIVKVYEADEAGYNHEKFMSAVSFLKSEDAYIGDTPIGHAVLKAADLLENKENAKIILITDGYESTPELAAALAGDKKWEEKLKTKYADYDNVLIPAGTSLEKALEKKISFTPILCGLKSVTKDRSTTDREAAEIRAFYEALAKQAGSVVMEASSAEGLASAVIDAESAGLTYTVYKKLPVIEKLMPKTKVAEGKAGIPIKLDAGEYHVVLNTVPPIEKVVTVKEGRENTYFLRIGKDGIMDIVPSE
jgi:hypothetical protein